MMTRLAGTAVLALSMTWFIVASASADNNVRNSPPDTTHYSRPLVPEDLNPLDTGNTPPPVARNPGWQKPSTDPIYTPSIIPRVR
jgi:hypothetical protein